MNEQDRMHTLSDAIKSRMPEGTIVDVDAWAGYEPDEDEPAWGLPVYIKAWPQTGHEDDGTYYDAVLDMDAASVGDQAAFAVEQLTQG